MFHGARMLDDKYEIIREIKKGGFGIVYYGLDKKLNKPVAIKEIAPNLLDDPKYIDMFQEEALNIAKLSHNNIVHIYELKKTTDRHLYIIMEFIDGTDMEKVIRHCRKHHKLIPHHLAVYVVSEICQALEYAHQRRDAFTNKPLNLVHQDISPSNIMISRFGAVKLIDFGIASVRRHHKDKKDSKLRGKIPYMAPEQLIMGNHPDHRSDLFSLGLVLFESITGERLFTTQEEVISAGKNPKWFKKALKGKKIPTPLVKILLRALEIDLSKRYQSANHMYIDLLQYLISCNETGELMDDLASFLSDQFSQITPPLTPPNYSAPSARSQIAATPVINYAETTPSTTWQTPEPSVLNNSPNLSPKIEAPPPRSLNPQPLPAAERFPTNFNTMEVDVEGEEDLKTVIDVLRISARNNKKRIVQACVGVLLAVLTFFALDTFNRWTPAGTWLYDLMFPPAIEITTVPGDATIFLDGEPVAGRTPLSINEISPGVHKLEISLPGYKPIVKSLFVPRDGDIRVQGANADRGKRSYLFRFTTEIEINSKPPGAQVLVNGIRLNQRTPCEIAWEIGNPFSIELERTGFERIGRYTLNTVTGIDEVDDRRMWLLDVYNDDYKKYAITGIFRKRIDIESIPAGVEIYDQATGQMIGLAGSSSGLLLPVGQHNLEFRKQGFISKTITLDIDERFDERLTVVLSRRIRFTAREANDSRDINATLVSIKSNNRELLRGTRRTPFEIVLPAYSLTAVFTKDGYQRKRIPVSGSARSVVAELEPLKTDFNFEVVDALTEQPLSGANIFVAAAGNGATGDKLLASTNAGGQGIGRLPAGTYVFSVRKSGYNELNRTIIVQAGDAIDMVFELFPSN